MYDNEFETKGKKKLKPKMKLNHNRYTSNSLPIIVSAKLHPMRATNVSLLCL